MPTKPAESITIWSSNANHLFGDYPGDATKVSPGAGIIAAGLIPGDPAPPTAEELNYTWNLWTKWLEWVELGTAVGDADAHIVETNADGEINARRATFLTDTNGQPAVFAASSDEGPGVWGTGVDFHGIHGQSQSASSAHYGVFGEGFSNSGGVRGQGAGAALGGMFTGGATGIGLRGDGGATSGAGATFNGTGGEPDIFLAPAGNFGIVIDAGPTAFGGMAITADEALAFNATQADPDWGVMALYGASGAAVLVPTLDVYASGDGNAISANNINGTGYALRLRPKSAAPTRGAVFCSGQAARPTDITRGQFTYLSTEGQWAHSEFGDFGNDPGGGWRGFLSTVGGSALGYGYASLVTGAAVGTYKSAVTCNATGGNAPKLAGRQVLMTITLAARSATVGSAAKLNLRLYDITADPAMAGFPLFERSGSNGYHLPSHAALTWSLPMSISFLVTIPAAGDRNWTLRFASDGPGVCDVKDVTVSFGPGML